MTVFDKAWTFLKNDTGDGYSPDVRPWEKANYNPPIPEGAVEGPDGLEWKRGLDPDDSRLKDALQPMSDFQFEEGLRANPPIGGDDEAHDAWLADLMAAMGHDDEIEPPEPDNSVSEGPDWRDER